MEVNEQPTDWKSEKASAAAQTVLTQTPDLAGIYMQSDSVMLPGILNLLKSSGKLKKVGEPGHIPLISIDGTQRWRWVTSNTSIKQWWPSGSALNGTHTIRVRVVDSAQPATAAETTISVTVRNP